MQSQSMAQQNLVNSGNLVGSMMSSTEKIQFESLNKFHLEDEPIDLNDDAQLKSRMQAMLDKYILPLEESNRNYN